MVHRYSKNNRTLGGYKNDSLNLGTIPKFNTTIERLTHKARMILKKGWFSNKMHEIWGEVGRKEYG